MTATATQPKMRLLDWFFAGYRAAWMRVRVGGEIDGALGAPSAPAGTIGDEYAVIAYERGWRQAGREFRAGRR